MQTVSLQLSKALFEKGLKIETEKTYCDISGQWREEKPHFVLYESDIAKARQQNQIKELHYPAPSTDELMAMMPQTLGDNSVLMIIKSDNLYTVDYWIYRQNKNVWSHIDKFLPEALGKMCLWLLGNGYIYDEKERMIRRKE